MDQVPVMQLWLWPMQEDEAQALSCRLWGTKGYAKTNKTNHLHDVGVVCDIPGWEGEPLRELYGWGDTWEQAFMMAEFRLKARRL